MRLGTVETAPAAEADEQRQHAQDDLRDSPDSHPRVVGRWPRFCTLCHAQPANRACWFRRRIGEPSREQRIGSSRCGARERGRRAHFRGAGRGESRCRRVAAHVADRAHRHASRAAGRVHGGHARPTHRPARGLPVHAWARARSISRPARPMRILGAMPMLMLTGQKPIKNPRQARFQMVDIVGTMRPLTKMTRQIVSAASIPTMVRDAFRIATEERPGSRPPRAARRHRRRGGGRAARAAASHRLADRRARSRRARGRA